MTSSSNGAMRCSASSMQPPYFCMSACRVFKLFCITFSTASWTVGCSISATALAIGVRSATSMSEGEAVCDRGCACMSAGKVSTAILIGASARFVSHVRDCEQALVLAQKICPCPHPSLPDVFRGPDLGSPGGFLPAGFWWSSGALYPLPCYIRAGSL